MNRILSWKIDSSTYAYIFPVKNSYISNRIPEDSLLWGEIINEISTWTKDIYRANFDKMASEVKSKYGQTILWQDQYWDFSDDNTNLPVNIVLLAGKDGEGYANGGNGTGSGEGDEVYDEFVDAINKELDKAKKDIEEQNKRVEEFVEQKVGETIAEAKNTIAETKKELADTRKELEGKLDGAADALEKAAALFDMGEGGITGEKIQEALTSVDECREWLTANSGTVNEFKTDYDAAKEILGGVGSAEDASVGLFSRFGTAINNTNKTVGNVHKWMVASAATIGDVATWYDTNASAVTEASRIINASAGTITDAINFINGDGLTTEVERVMDGKKGTIKDEIMTETSSAVTNVRNVLNGLSGVVETSITRLDGVDGRLTKMGKEMDAVKDEMKTYMTVSDSAMTLATDLRDTWSVESGKLSTVASLTAQVDGEGNVMYFVSGSTDSESDDIRVWKGDDGIWRDSNGVTYKEEDVIVHWNQKMGSYIQQQASSVTISVMNSSSLTAAIKTAIKRGENGEEESVIELISDKLVITGEMIANAISATTANIGNILIGNGKIECAKIDEKDNKPYFLLDGHEGFLYAKNADIEGTIRATSGYFKGELMANTGKIGGFTLTDNRLMVSNDNFDKPIAYLNGSSEYSDGERGTIILAAGVKNGSTYYKYTCNGDTEYSTIFTKKQYSINSGDTAGCEVEAYKYNADTRTYRRLANQFYFLTITSNQNVGGEIIYSGRTDDGLEYFTRECIVRKYIEVREGEVLEEMMDEYTYTHETTGDTEEVANTRIFEDGTIISNSLVADDGYFGGEINSIGRFRGTLENAGGTLKGVAINANLINGNIVIRDSDSIKAKSDNQLYFNVGKESLSEKGAKEYWNIDKIFLRIDNYNGENAGQWYDNTSTVASVQFKSGATITIPVLDWGIFRYAAEGKRTNEESYLWAEGNVSYSGKTEEILVLSKALIAPAHSDGSTQYIPEKVNSSAITFEAKADGVLSLKFRYRVHLSTYSPFKAHISAAEIAFNTGGSKITVKYEEPTKGVSIASNGMRVLTVSGVSVTIINDTITMLSQNKRYGLKITNEGLFKRTGVGEKDWTPI